MTPLYHRECQFLVIFLAMSHGLPNTLFPLLVGTIRFIKAWAHDYGVQSEISHWECLQEISLGLQPRGIPCQPRLVWYCYFNSIIFGSCYNTKCVMNNWIFWQLFQRQSWIGWRLHRVQLTDYNWSSCPAITLPTCIVWDLVLLFAMRIIRRSNDIVMLTTPIVQWLYFLCL